MSDFVTPHSQKIFVIWVDQLVAYSKHTLLVREDDTLSLIISDGKSSTIWYDSV